MSSSITCPAPLLVDEFQSSIESYGTAIHGLNSYSVEGGTTATRRKREFMPEERKDSTYWLKRSRNNESAKRSRLRRRMEECLLEARAVELLRENEKLKAALSAMHYHNISVKNHFDGVVGRPVGPGTSRDTYLVSLADCSAHVPGVDSYAFGSRGQGQRLGPTNDLGMENFSLPNTLTTNAIENVYQRDRNLGCHLGIPTCQSGNLSVPVTYELCQGEAAQSHGSPQNFSFSGPYPRSQMVVPPDPRLAEPWPTCGNTRVQLEGSGPDISQSKVIGNESNPTKEPERSSVLPLLPHKLRYKVSKAWRHDNKWETIQPHPVQRAWE